MNRITSTFSNAFAFIALALFFSLPQAHASDLYVSPEIAEARLKGDQFVVTSTKDSGAGSLRQAIADAANASSDGSVITFSSKLNGKTIVLSSGELVVAQNAPPLEITAAGLSKGVTIDARQTSRVLNTQSGTDVQLTNLTITGGKTADVASGSGDADIGGGIYSQGQLALFDCKVIGNTTGKGGPTGGRGGHGGGIFHESSDDLNLVRCSISNNSTGDAFTTYGGNGGAIRIIGGGALNVTDSTFADNSTGSGPATVSNNGSGWGGAIYTSTDLNIQNSTFARNRCENLGRGGAIDKQDGGGVIANSTFFGNFAGQQGGAINERNFSQTSYINCTVAGNEGGVAGGGLLTTVNTPLENTIILNNTAPTHSNVDAGSIGGVSGVNFFGNTPLAPLGDYGGLTQTMPPIPGVTNIVIFGNGAPAFTPATDQRGVKHIQGPEGTFSGRRGDLGAVEVSTDCQLIPRLMIENGATVFTVTSTKDSGKGTLRQAILDANATAGESVIVFSTKLNGKTITLTSGELVVFGKTAIIGASLGKGSTEPVDLASGVSISGNQNSRVFRTDTNSDVLMRNLTIRDGVSGFEIGAGIYTVGHLLMCDCVVTENETSDRGGGVFVSSGSESTVIIRSKISNNTSGPNGFGAGGGIYSSNQLVCVDSEISGNRTGDAGAGVSASGAGVYVSIGPAKFFGCTINDNHTGSGTTRGFGGGVFAGSSTELTNCTITGNSARFGGGLRADGGALLTHCTVVGNSADDSGGAIGFANSATLKNTIVSDNTAPVNPNNAGTPIDNGGNFLVDGALLLPLGDYGGPTKTRPPSGASTPVLDQINTIDVAHDQIGAFRTGPAEIGAVDFTPAVLNFAARAADPPTPFSPGETDVNAIDPAAAGTFSGILTDPTTGKAVGTMTVKMSASGAVSIAFSQNELGLKSGFKAGLDNNGKINGVLTIKGVDYNIFLELVRTSGGENKFKFDGTFGRVGDTLYDVSLDRSGYNKKTNPAPMAGKYTSLLPATLDQSAPQGDGYGLVSVGTDGKVKFAGALGDGTKFTVGGFVSEDSEWRLFKDLYRTKPKGNIGGVVTFADLDNVSDFNGSLSWMKMADAKEKLYKDGFNIETQKIIGSLYNAPYPNEAILAPIATNQPNNATFDFGKGNIDTPDKKFLTWDGKNKVKANGLTSGQSLAIAPSTKSGIVKGSYIDKSTKQKISFTGVAFQKQNVISGWFPGNEESGFFSIRPSGGGVFLQLTEVVTGNNHSVGFFGLGSVGIDGGIAEIEYKLVNEGSGNVTIHGIDLSNEDAFFLKNGPVNKVLAPGESVFFVIAAAPQVIGSHQTTMTVRSDGGNFQPSYIVTGVGGSGDGVVVRDTTEWFGTQPSDQAPEFTTTTQNYNPTTHGGTYQGFTHQGAGESVTGFVTVKAGTKNAAISGTAVINGVKESFKGTVNSNGSFASTTNRGRNVSFFLARVTDGSGGFKLIGAFAGDNGGHQFELVRSGFHKTTNPNTDFDGLFTMVLPSADNRGADTPNGDGYGTASIGIDGRSKATLILGDGTKATHAGFVSVDGEWMIHKDLYRTKPKGHIAGRLVFRDEAGISDFDGELQWVKHADPKEKRFNRGFEIRQITLGSVYTPAANGERAFARLDLTNGTTSLFFIDGDVPNIPKSSFGDWATTNKVTVDTMDPTQKFSVKVNPKNGVVTGTYTDKLRKKKIPFGGVIFEKQNILTGHFIGTNNTGVFGIFL